ncbi:methyltransferase domain-containing protein [Macromonas bipunctata]|uniref:methyltransferase domain-containing protein n=1 Tax=Macromonas bipunctata TaxID=183670 RepID=UPI000C332DE9|nr:methyltransferase domain-containing protein [Macromonas bipunctata]
MSTTASYYQNVNPDLLARVPLDARHILEVGCGNGNFARAVLARQPQAAYVGVELFAQAAQEAQGVLSHVVVGDVEQSATLKTLDQICDGQSGGFDALVLGDVLEHLRDPWQVLAQLRERTVLGGTAVACVPNVAHWSLLQQQLCGRWDYAEQGLLDRTHLRFFTLETLLDLFRHAGWTVVDAAPRVLWPEQTQAALKRFLPLAQALGRDPKLMQRDLSAFQWVVRAVNGPAPAPLRVTALSMKKTAGVSEARIDYPLTALATRPGVRTLWRENALALPPGGQPGVVVLHRQFLNHPDMCRHVDALAQRGWVVVSDMDDDPHHWREFVDSGFYAYRGVHAVSVSTEPLAEMVRQWNPNVQVFGNAMLALPVRPERPLNQAQPLRVFFGALNRGPDWDAVRDGVLAAVVELGQQVQWVVVHERAVFDALPTEVSKEFYPTLAHDRYMQVLASCDVALLPLNDTPFNRLKSDLKLVECCAAGVVPVCSPVVYGDVPAHAEIAVLARTPQQWQQALLDLCRQPQELARRRALGLDYVKRQRMHSQQVTAREAWYRQLLAQQPVLEAQRQARVTDGVQSLPI